MATVKLDLHNKSIPAKIQQARNVLTKLGTPPPAAYTTTAGDLKTATNDLEEASNDYEAEEKVAEGLLETRNTQETAFDKAFNTFGSAVQTNTQGDEQGIIATGLDVRSQNNAPVSNLDPVTGFNVTTTNVPATFDFTWDRADGDKTFELRWRQASTPAGQYDGTKTTTKTRLRLGGFTSGMTYIFDLRAHGAGEAESAWCNPFTKIAP